MQHINFPRPRHHRHKHIPCLLPFTRFTMVAIAVRKSAITISFHRPSIRGLQLFSMGSSTYFFGFSTLLGKPHLLHLPRVIALATAAFELTLLCMAYCNWRRPASTLHDAPTSGIHAPTLAEEEAQSHCLPQPGPPPVACRKGPFLLRNALYVGWMAALELAVVEQFMTKTHNTSAVVEILWIGGQLVTALIVWCACVLEHERAFAARFEERCGQGEWYGHPRTGESEGGGGFQHGGYLELTLQDQVRSLMRRSNAVGDVKERCG